MIYYKCYSNSFSKWLSNVVFTSNDMTVDITEDSRLVLSANFVVSANLSYSPRVITTSKNHFCNNCYIFNFKLYTCNKITSYS